MKSFIPYEIRGPIDSIDWSDDVMFWWGWARSLRGKSIWVHLGASWVQGQDSVFPPDPPPGFDIYIIQGDSNMLEWAQKLAFLDYIPVIINLVGPEIYSNEINNKIRNIEFCFYHQQTKFFNRNETKFQTKPKKYKIGCMTNRLTQSKCIIHAALLDSLPDEFIVYSLHSEKYETKNVHHWQLSGNETCDRYIELFKNNHLGKVKLLDTPYFDPFDLNILPYTESIFNLTQESFHYSLMQDQNSGQVKILPGPFLTEKTWKAIITGVAIIPVGQFRSLAWLKKQGFLFDYGDLDLDFDNDPGNLTRMEKLIQLIKDIGNRSMDELDSMTLASRLHNKEYFWSDAFYDSCEKINQNICEKITALL